MRPALDAESLRDVLESWAAKWLAKGQRCDWCGHELRDVSDLREYLDWCLTLREAWPSTAKRLPADAVFCVDCAVGAINELHGGPRHVARRMPKPAVPTLVEDEVPF